MNADAASHRNNPTSALAVRCEVSPDVGATKIPFITVMSVKTANITVDNVTATAKVHILHRLCNKSYIQ